MTDQVKVAKIGLTQAESKRLDSLERKIDKGLKVFMEVGEALAEISEQRLYRATHGSFAEYVQDRWGVGRDYAYKQIAASKVVAVLSTDVDAPPRNEATARPLAALLDEPDELRKAWTEAREIARAEGREPMADDVIDTVVWKARRQAKVAALKKPTQKSPEKTNRARLLEAMAVITEIPGKVGNIDLEGVRKIDTRADRDQRVQLVQDADAALMELMEALEPAEVVT